MWKEQVEEVIAVGRNCSSTAGGCSIAVAVLVAVEVVSERCSGVSNS